MSRSVTSIYWAWFLGSLTVTLAAATAAPGDVFTSLPHLKKPHRPICNSYGECYGHFQVTYRAWPAQCLVNPSLAAPARSLREALPSPIPLRETLPPPTPVPDGAPAKPGSGPVLGIIFEIEEDSGAAHVRLDEGRTQAEAAGSPFPPR